MTSKCIELTSRKHGGRKKRKAIVLFVEGESEKTYFEWFRQHEAGVALKIQPTKMAGLESIHRTCMNYKKTHPVEKDDIHIVIIDVDNRSASEINDFIKKCEKNGMDVFVSNPSFEVWLLMHFKDVTGNPNQNDLERRLSEAMGYRYKKSEGIRMTPENIRSAIERGYKKTDSYRDMREKNIKNGPWTDLHFLVDKIMKREY